MNSESTEPRPEPVPSLGDLVTTCWDSHVAGAERARHPFHTGVLGTGSGEGYDLRTVVLRRVDREQRTLICHTDQPTSKIAQLRTTPATSWLFYDDRKKVQLRLYGMSTVHADDDRALDLLSRIPTLEESEPWRDRFAAIVTRVDRMEWLYLRARFDWSDETLRSTWLVP